MKQHFSQIKPIQNIKKIINIEKLYITSPPLHQIIQVIKISSHNPPNQYNRQTCSTSQLFRTIFLGRETRERNQGPNNLQCLGTNLILTPQTPKSDNQD